MKLIAIKLGLFTTLGFVAVGFAQQAKISPNDLEASIQDATKLSYGERQASLSVIAHATREMAEYSPKVAASLALMLPDTPGTQESKRVSNLLKAIARTWIKTDSASAGRWAQQVPLTYREDVEQTVASEWAKRNKKAALEWVETIEDDGERGTALVAVISELKKTDPRGAAALARQIPKLWQRDEALVQVAVEMVKIDPQNAMTIVEEITQDSKALHPLREEALKGVMMEWAKYDPAEAVDIADRLISIWKLKDTDMLMSGGDRVKFLLNENAIGRFAYVWAKSDREAALTWVYALPPNYRRRALVGLGKNPDQVPPDRRVSSIDIN